MVYADPSTRSKSKEMPDYTDDTSKPQESNYVDRDLDLSAFGEDQNKSVIGYNLIEGIKESHPEDYIKKLEKNYQGLEKKVKRIKKENLKLKQENSRLKDSNATLEFVN